MNFCGVTGLLLIMVLLVSEHTSDAQHWSYDMQPGGKRDAESLQDAYGEVPNEVPLFTEHQRIECASLQNRLNLLRGALIHWLDGDNARSDISHG
uniref:Gonadotropin releasing hormone peptide n=1 Tax=Microhyla ornata TaxID=143526 RepID=A0A2Z5U5G7_MICON|nr:gonadotropin releasing hormone peptide [Microhyla ornata]